MEWLGLEVTPDDIRQALPNIDFAGVATAGGLEMFAPDMGKVRQGPPAAPLPVNGTFLALAPVVASLALASVLRCMRRANGAGACAPLFLPVPSLARPLLLSSWCVRMMLCAHSGTEMRSCPTRCGLQGGASWPPSSPASTEWTTSGSTPRPGM